MATPYELLGKEDGVKALSKAFYQAMDSLPEAADIRRMHGESLDDIEQKLFEYLNGWLGGPHLYQEKYQTVCLTKPHKPYKIDESARDQWLLCWDHALDAINASGELKEMMAKPIFTLADFMVNHRP